MPMYLKFVNNPNREVDFHAKIVSSIAKISKHINQSFKQFSLMLENLFNPEMHSTNVPKRPRTYGAIKSKSDDHQEEHDGEEHRSLECG